MSSQYIYNTIVLPADAVDCQGLQNINCQPGRSRLYRAVQQKQQPAINSSGNKMNSNGFRRLDGTEQPGKDNIPQPGPQDVATKQHHLRKHLLLEAWHAH